MSEREHDGAGEAGGGKGLLNKAADMMGGMVGKASAATAGSHSSAAFVANACVGDHYEIAAGMIAAERGRSDTVRAFGQMMVEHHTTAMHQMQAALASSEVARDLPDLAPPAELDERRQGMIRHLREAPDEDFDRTYLDQQRMAHQETVTLHRGYAEHGDNPQLRSVALGGLPMIERHLKAVERIGVH
jgi:putative membrane protein